MKPKISIIIPTSKISNFIIFDIIPSLQKQTYNNFELLIATPDIKKFKFPNFVKIIKTKKGNNPALARDIAVKRSIGSILAFIDDDSYPSESWCENIIKYIKKPNIAAVCGPGLTPKNNNLKQKISGFFWKSWLGAGGVGIYRCQKQKKRFVDDFPTFNLIVKKSDFKKIGGFNSNYWPGEDTKLCHDLVYKLNKQILYHPDIYVFHHRREIYLPHLKQISRYGFQRGRFTKLFPKTSKRFSYYLPSLFTLYLLIIFLFDLSYYLQNLNTFIFKSFIYFPFLIYLILLFISSIQITIKSRNLLIGLLEIPTIFLSHLVYGVYFLKGIFSTNK